MQPNDCELFAAFAGQKSYRKIAKKNNIGTGALKVLLGVAFRQVLGKNTRRSSIYELKTGAKTLIRAHLAALIKSNLLHTAGPATVRPSLDGLRVVGEFQRQLREDRRAFSQG
jgi:hypothetical protein